MTALTTLPSGIRGYLDDYVARSRRVALLRGAGLGLAGFGLWMLACCAADRLAQFPATVRWACLGMGVVLLMAGLMPPAIALRRRPDWVTAAGEVERQNPRFAQRLLTVTSRVLGSAEYRGSDEILLRLMREVDEQVAADRSRRLVPVAGAVRPWAVCAVLCVALIALTRAPDLRFPDLAVRFLNPAAAVPPVTTTELDVWPGDQDVLQSRPLTIEARAARLGNAPVLLELAEDGRHWSRITMNATGGGRYAFTLAAIDHDLAYHVLAGDARTRDYAVRVLRRPSVSRLRVHYVYPAYTGLRPTTLTVTDGHIEAPAGTRAILSVTATEPLSVALLTVGGDKLLMDATSDPYTRQAEIVIHADARYSLDLISTRNVPGTGPSGTTIHAMADLPPQVRLARGGEGLRLNPRDLVPMAYEASDDFGLRSLVVRARVNGIAAPDVPLKLWGDHRRQQDVYNFDLATLPLAMGDLVTLTLDAQDTAGQSVVSEPIRVLIAPRVVDADAYDRVAELNNARQLARALADQLEEGAKAEDEAQGQSDHLAAAFISAASRGDRSLSSAAQSATLLRQSLLRAVTRSRSPALSTAIEGWIDRAEQASAAAEDAFRLSGSGAIAAPARQRLHGAADQARQLQADLSVAADGEQARVVAADRDNLQAAEAAGTPQDEPARRRRDESLQRMRQDVAAEATRLGLDPAAGDLDARLHERLAAADALIDAARPVDFAAAARQWAEQMRADPRQRLGLESRLSAAAQAEAVRPESDLIRARDLELAARAAVALGAALRGGGSGAPGNRAPEPAVLAAFADDLEQLGHRHPLPTTGPATAPSDDAALEAEARAARDLARWAGDPDGSAATATAGASTAVAASGTTEAFAAADRQRGGEDLAMQASAAAARHQYDRAAALDQAMARRIDGRSRHEARPNGALAGMPEAVDRIEHHRQAVRREMNAARHLDDLGVEQQRLAVQAAGNDALRQLSVAERIALVERQRAAEDDGRAGDGAAVPATARDHATAAVLAAQEQLASMPQGLADAQAAAAIRRSAAARAAEAHRSATGAAPDQHDAAARAADQADRDAADAAERLRRAARPVAPGIAQAMADRLAPFAPEVTTARIAIVSQLVPALVSLDQALPGDDAGATDRAASSVRQAIEAAQRELAAAQDELVRRDPLVAAKLFARAAADSLAARPPDVGRARRQQAGVSVALTRAWDQSIRRAAAERLAQVPTLAAVLAPAAPGGAGPSADDHGSAARFPAAREWGRLRAQDGPEINAAAHAADPPGYEESLKLYFEAIGKAREVK